MTTMMMMVVVVVVVVVVMVVVRAAMSCWPFGPTLHVLQDRLHQVGRA